MTSVAPARLVPVAIAVLFLATFSILPGVAAQDAPATRPAVVVELFTSQGCSSCPPADDLLGELAGRADVIALSLHVDYWDYIGWKDPFGSPMHTARQRRYAEELGLRYVYTPQMIVDGRINAVGSRRDEVLDAIERAGRQRAGFDLSFVKSGGGKVVIPAGTAPENGATIWLAVFDRSHETEIKRGENAGRKLRNTNVVRSLERLGTWMGQRLEIPLDLAGAAARGRDGCAVIVQQGRNGPVLAAAVFSLDMLR